MRAYLLLLTTCILVYVFNSLGLVSSSIGNNYFLKNHLNDLLCMPIAIPLMFAAFYYTKLRQTPFPNLIELMLHLIIWSTIFEVIGPQFLNKGVGDIYDVICYVIGTGAIAVTLDQESFNTKKQLA